MSDVPRILLVDADFATRLVASEALVAEGFDPIDADSGQEALDYFDRVTAAADEIRAHGESGDPDATTGPAAILVDANLPEGDGAEIIRQLRQRAAGATVPLILMTAADDLDAVDRAYAAGASGFVVKPLDLPLLARRMRFAVRAAAAASTALAAVEQVARAEQQIAQLSYYDDLTGIPNRQLVDRVLRLADPSITRAAIAIDLGSAHLDRLAVSIRDVLIRAATARVIERVRGADLEIRLDQLPRPAEAFTGPVLVARTSADELLVVIEAPAGGAAAALACQLAEVLAQPFPIAGAELTIRPRFGVAEYPEPISELRRLAEHARIAMHEAERTAARNVVALTAAARELRARRAELADQLALAIDLATLAAHPELTVEYVARVEPVTRQPIGMRARARWQPTIDDPNLLAAVLAADPALRDRLASWALKQACSDAGHWLATGRALRLAVELPCSLITPALVHELPQLCSETGFEPLMLDLELIELPTGLDDLDRLAGVLRSLRALGVRIALGEIDDRRSLGELRRLPIDALRIERSTIERLGRTYLATVAAIARGVALRITVTEIDAPAGLAALDECEPHELGGLLFGAAVPAASVPELTGEPVAGSPVPTELPATGIQSRPYAAVHLFTNPVTQVR